jgi:hypothetical protein
VIAVAVATLFFTNGTQLELPDEVGDDIASRLSNYLRNPQPANRVAAVRYSANGGVNNRVVTVDLQSLACVLHK